MKMTVKCLIVPLVFMLLKYGQTEGTDPCVNQGLNEDIKRVKAVVGRDVTLPCFSKLPFNAADDILVWSKGDSEIYIIRDGKPFSRYKSRASVPIEEFKKGDVSLKLFHVMESDEGQYCCCINRHNVRECTAVNLSQTEGTDPCVNVNIRQETAVNGSDVILKCFPKLPINADHDILEWKKGESEIYTIREGKAYGPYKDRASVPIEEFKKGDASLKLFHVMESEEGQYCCCINRHNERECTTVNLTISEEDKKKKEESKEKKVTDTSGLIIGLSVAGGLNLVLAAGVCIYCCKQRHQNQDRMSYQVSPTEEPPS